MRPFLGIYSGVTNDGNRDTVIFGHRFSGIGSRIPIQKFDRRMPIQDLRRKCREIFAMSSQSMGLVNAHKKAYWKTPTEMVKF